jgi:hypothetical protein
MNKPHWSAARQAIEAFRSKTSRLMDPTTLQEILPPCNVPFDHDNPFTSGTLCRNVLGFLFWLENYPQTFSGNKDA